MINRILIRIKVVQLLYSYMLNRHEFKIVPQPSASSREKRSAYNTYRDLLLIILELSGYNVDRNSPGAVSDAKLNKYMNGNQMVKALAANAEIKEMITREGGQIKAFAAILPALYSEITKSSAYRSFTHRKEHDINTDTQFWEILLETTIKEYQPLQTAMRAAHPDDFSLNGYEQGFEMALKTLEDFRHTGSSFIEARNALDTSLRSAYTLYHGLLQLIVDLTRMQELRQDNARNKYLPSAADLNPNTRLVDNRLAASLAKSETLQDYFKDTAFSWESDDALLRSLLDSIVESDIYKNYIESPDDTFAADAEFWRQAMKAIILPSDALNEALEDKSIYWNDDLNIMGTFVLKTLKQYVVNGPEKTCLLPMFKDDEDKAFGPDLFLDVIKNQQRYRELIDNFINKETWDSERLALMDVIIMMTAISELLNYPGIPIAVTLNEYIEIANGYSTNQSGRFINGLLYSIINHLKETNLILKN